MIITNITKYENGYWKGCASDGEDRFKWDCLTNGDNLCILKKNLGHETTTGDEFWGVIRRAKDFPVGAKESIVAAIAAASNAVEPEQPEMTVEAFDSLIGCIRDDVAEVCQGQMNIAAAYGLTNYLTEVLRTIDPRIVMLVCLEVIADITKTASEIDGANLKAA
jgi:hypothetical protein